MMLRGVQIELDNRKSTPFTLLFAIYNARLALKMNAFEELEISKQCEYLQSNKINKKSARKSLLKDLVEKESNFNELSEKAHIRIHVKYILSLFYKQSEKLKKTTKISSWSKDEIILSFISHLIEAWQHDDSADKKNTAHIKIWEFVNYLRKYFNDTQYDGQQFLSSFNVDDDKANNKPTKGFGLQMMKTVCSKYQLKSGPYSKVKKQCNIWATKLHSQSQGKGIDTKVFQ